MPVELGIWRIDEGVRRLATSPLSLEALLEDAIEKDPSMLGIELLIVGRQVQTDFGHAIDLLALDGDGFVYVIELKRDKTPREVVAQTLEYGVWVSKLTYEQVVELYGRYKPGATLEDAYRERFGIAPDSLNEQHRLVIVASGLDASTERIIAYLSGDFGVPVNALFFRHFEDGERRYLARSWLIEPAAAEAVRSKSVVKRTREPWNGQDFYVAVGGSNHRSWDDMRRYGFISAGGGRWYSRTLEQLFPDARIFACIPGSGYVGVGTVEDRVVPVRQFTADSGEGRRVPLLDLPLEGKMLEFADDPENAEHVVRVRWVKTLPREKAVWERGMFANQNSACALRDKFTLDRLTSVFEL